MIKGIGMTERLVNEIEYIWIVEMQESKNDKWHIGQETYLTRKDARNMKKWLEYVKDGRKYRIKKYERVD